MVGRNVRRLCGRLRNRFPSPTCISDLELRLLQRQTRDSCFMLSFLKTLVHRCELCKIILTFDANAELLNFTKKVRAASGKYRVNCRLP